MNKNIIIVSGVIVLGLVVWGLSMYTGKQDAMLTEEGNTELSGILEQEGTVVEKEIETTPVMNKDAGVKDEGTVMEKKEATVVKPGSYEAYSKEKVMMASETHDVVLFFRASWCPSCITVDKNIKANLGNIPSSLTILDVNYDNSSELKKKYGVTYQHTFVQVDKDGTLIKKWSGSPTLAALVSEVQ